MRYIAFLIVILALAGPARAAGDAVRGKSTYESLCVACHALDRNRTGPKHCGVLGRKAGIIEGFNYSPAMRSAGIVWDEKNLDRFLVKPSDVVPKTWMPFGGIKEADRRADIIAYLATNKSCDG